MDKLDSGISSLYTFCEKEPQKILNHKKKIFKYFCFFFTAKIRMEMKRVADFASAVAEISEKTDFMKQSRVKEENRLSSVIKLHTTPSKLERRKKNEFVRSRNIFGCNRLLYDSSFVI